VPDGQAARSRVAPHVLREQGSVEHGARHQLPHARAPYRERHGAGPPIGLHRIVGAELERHELLALEPHAREAHALIGRRALRRELRDRRALDVYELAILVPRHARDARQQRDERQRGEEPTEDRSRHRGMRAYQWLRSALARLFARSDQIVRCGEGSALMRAVPAKGPKIAVQQTYRSIRWSDGSNVIPSAYTTISSVT
jgi:hypothetical protein